MIVLAENQPKRRKANFNIRLEGQDYLGFAVWPAKNESGGEVIAVDVRRLEGDSWNTIGRLAIYRATDGTYRKLPEREKP
jgi:hypothetical protein